MKSPELCTGLCGSAAAHEDDAHIFMREDQVTDEIQGVMRLIDEVYQKFGFTYEIELSTRPENSMGSDEEWELATNALKKAVIGMNKSVQSMKEMVHFTVPNLIFI